MQLNILSFIKKVNSSSGMSLIEVVVACAFVGALVLILSNVSTFGVQSRKSLELRHETEDLKNYVRKSVDCRNTVKDVGNSCKGKKPEDNFYVQMRTESNVPFINKYPVKTDVGGVSEIRASCSEVGDLYTFKIEAVQVKNGKVSKDSFRQRTSSWQPLFDDTVDITCQGRSGWFQALNKHCPAFCTSIGLSNTVSPDSWTGVYASPPPPPTNPSPSGLSGSRCTSGEVIPPSAGAAAIAGDLTYPNGCWWGPCPTGSDMHLGTSFGSYCYGTKWAGGPQGKDSDQTDRTVGCHCE